MRHKIKIDCCLVAPHASVAYRWYVTCLNEECGDTWVELGDDACFGRPTWEAALALGIAHQQNANGRGEYD